MDRRPLWGRPLWGRALWGRALWGGLEQTEQVCLAAAAEVFQQVSRLGGVETEQVCLVVFVWGGDSLELVFFSDFRVRVVVEVRESSVADEKDQFRHEFVLSSIWRWAPPPTKSRSWWEVVQCAAGSTY